MSQTENINLAVLIDGDNIPSAYVKEKMEEISNREIRLIADSITDLSDDDGWAFLGDVGGLIQKKRPNFDPRNYGFQKLTPLINSTGKFEIEQRENQKGRYKLIYVRNKEKRITRDHKASRG